MAERMEHHGMMEAEPHAHGRPVRRSSWGAIFAGMFTALAIMLTLDLLALAIGLTAVNPGEPNNPVNWGIGAAVWWIVAAWIGFFFGGMVAARMSGFARPTDGAIHGIVTWAFTGMVMLRQSTPLGMGLNTDSVYYVNGARNIFSGNGFYRNSGEDVLKPITHFPPFFSVILAGVELSGLDPLRGGRLVIILLYGLNVCLFAWLVFLLTRSRLLGLIAAVFMTFSPVNLREYSILMSEPLYLSLGLTNLIIAWYYLQSRKSWLICLLGLSAGLMDMTRYIGLSVILAWLVFFLIAEKTWRNRLGRAGLFLVFSLPLGVGVMLHNYLLTGSTGNRTLIFHPIPLEKIFTGMRNFWSWFLPPGSESLYKTLEGFFIGIFIILVITGLFMLIRSIIRLAGVKPVTVREAFLVLIGMNIVIYLTSVFITINLFDATTVFDNRMLLPVYLSVLLFILVGADWQWRRDGRNRHALLLAGLAVVLPIIVIGSLKTVSILSQDGQGFLGSYWRESPTMDYIREHDIGLFYTNQPPTVYILTGKAGYMVPSPVDSLTLQARQSYLQDLATMKEKINRQDGLLIFFLEKGYETDPWYRDLTAGLVEIERTSDAIIWGRVE